MAHNIREGRKAIAREDTYTFARLKKTIIQEATRTEAERHPLNTPFCGFLPPGHSAKVVQDDAAVPTIAILRTRTQEEPDIPAWQWHATTEYQYIPLRDWWTVQLGYAPLPDFGEHNPTFWAYQAPKEQDMVWISPPPERYTRKHAKPEPIRVHLWGDSHVDITSYYYKERGLLVYCRSKRWHVLHIASGRSIGYIHRTKEAARHHQQALLALPVDWTLGEDSLDLDAIATAYKDVIHAR